MLTYDPGEVEVIFGITPLFGFAAGVMVRIERNNPKANPYKGTRGEGSRAMVRDGSYNVTVRLQSASVGNDELDLLTRVDEVTASGEAPLLIRDASGTTTFAGLDAFLLEEPTVEFGDEVSELDWVFYVDRAPGYHIGGNP